jgi:hypothetical protein
VRRHFSAGWGEFSYEYSYNPYVLRVQMKDLKIKDLASTTMSSVGIRTSS